MTVDRPAAPLLATLVLMIGCGPDVSLIDTKDLDTGDTFQVLQLPVGDPSCPHGGVRIIDVWDIYNVCNGAPGTTMTGPRGPQGSTGPGGPAGPEGAEGPTGEPGAQGEPGQSVRLSTIIDPSICPAGGIGIEDAFGGIDILCNGERGPAGPQGPMGWVGPAGPQGATGPQGTPGLDGAQGPTGAEGPQGARGVNGTTGPAGPQGAPGADAPAGAMVPVGGIILWSGAETAIPSGWTLCDGTNGTPDLRDRFVVGAGSSYPVGATGGAAMVTLSVNQIPAHNHQTGYYTQAHIEIWGSSEITAPLPSPTPTDGPWGAYFTSSVGGGAAHENRPPYYALAYIMRKL